ncbi:MAG: MBL fold metallo-hydrolase, partial [Pseudomonadota bacterium]
METLWEAYAVKYARVEARTRGNNFINDDDHAGPMPIEFFVWVLKDPDSGRAILVDTGFDEAEATRRGRPIDRHPAEAIKAIGVDPETITDVIVTHLHFDHAGSLDAFPNARFHLQEAEMVYATGPC